MFVWGCARMSAPSGGPKDVDPPKAVKSKPLNYSTNFNNTKIIIEFDEFVTLKNVRQELLVSPPLPEKAEVKQRGKNLIIKINNELQDSTTYNYNFYNSIADLNEGNALKNFQFEFSTGPEFDSIYLGGYVHNAFNYKTEASLYVMAYDTFNDTIPRTTLPNHVAKTDKDGNFFITNMKNKPFYVFALKDMNNNMLFDLPNESIAFIDSSFSPGFVEQVFVDTVSIIKSISPNLKDTVRADSLIHHKHMVTTIGNVRLFMFVEDFEQQFFKQAYRPERQEVIFSFNREVSDSATIFPIVNNKVVENWFLKEDFESNDSLVFWIKDSLIYNIDSLEFQINYTMKDSTNQNYLQTDTLLLSFTEPEKKETKVETKKKGIGRLNLNFLDDKKEETKTDSVIPPSPLTFVHTAKSPFDLHKDIDITARYPLKNFDESRIQLLRIEDDTTKIPVKFAFEKDPKQFRTYHISFNKDEEERFELFIPAGAITDIYDNINDTLTYKFKTQRFDYYATIAMHIKSVKDTAVLMLLDEKENVLEEQVIYSDTIINYTYLAPKKYKFKLYYDSNGNRKWDTGNYKELRQPERVFYYPFFPEILDIKSNIDIENTWELYHEEDHANEKPLNKAKTHEH